MGLKGVLAEPGAMNSVGSNSGGWDACDRRTWCNGEFKNSFPNTLKPIFKEFKVVTANGQGSVAITSNDYFTLPAEKEVFGTNTYADATAESELFHLEWYKVAANRQKPANERWWERSPYKGNSVNYCGVYRQGTPGGEMRFTASLSYYLSPFGCI